MALRFLKVLLWLACCSTTVAQAPFVPPEFYARTRPDFGNTLPLCILPNSPTHARDVAVATDLAELLLLEPAPVVMSMDMESLDAEGIWPAVFVHLAERCIGVMGVELIPGFAPPDWLTFTRPYLEAPYVLLTRDPEVQSLSDLPHGAKVGAPLYSPLDAELMNLIGAGSVDVTRLPYDDIDLAEELFGGGLLDALIVWEPHLQNRDRPALAAANRGSTVPLSQKPRAIGIAMRAQDQFLRALIDDGITSLSNHGASAP